MFGVDCKTDFGADCRFGVDGSERRLTGLRVTECSGDDVEIDLHPRLLLF